MARSFVAAFHCCLTGWVICPMARSFVCHDIYICPMARSCVAAFHCCLTDWFMCPMARSFVCHDWYRHQQAAFGLCLSSAWREDVFICPMTYSYACHDEFIHVPWRIRMCAMTLSRVCHEPHGRPKGYTYASHSFMPDTHSFLEHGRWIHEQVTVLQCVAACCSMLQCFTVCVFYSVLKGPTRCNTLQHRSNTMQHQPLHPALSSVTDVFVCPMDHSYVCHDTFIRVPWLTQPHPNGYIPPWSIWW